MIDSIISLKALEHTDNKKLLYFNLSIQYFLKDVLEVIKLLHCIDG